MNLKLKNRFEKTWNAQKVFISFKWRMRLKETGSQFYWRAKINL